jgi:hypothetical protein
MGNRAYICSCPRCEFPDKGEYLATLAPRPADQADVMIFRANETASTANCPAGDSVDYASLAWEDAHAANGQPPLAY